MAAPVKLNFKLYQGATFRETLRWESSTKAYRPISSVVKSAPVEISTVTEHGIPNGWRVRVSNVQGMKEINSDSYYTISSVLPGSFKINDINALGFGTYTSGGVVEFNEPVDLAGVTARMQIREKLESTEVIISLTTENGGIVIDNVAKTIALFISDEDTADMTFSSAVYSLELVKSGDVIPFINGNISLVKEVTR